MDDKDFTALLQDLRSSTLSVPSKHTLALWTSVADTYDPLALDPLWVYTQEQIRLYYRVTQVIPRSVGAAAATAKAVSMYLSQQDPRHPSYSGQMPMVASAYTQLTQMKSRPSWHTLQTSVELLSARWREVDR